MADSPITDILGRLRAGDRRAADELLPAMYDELRAVARSLMSARPQTLQPTALVHEAFLRLVKTDDPGWNSRGHFFGAAAMAMRRILVEQARRRARGTPAEMVEPEPLFAPPDSRVLDVDAALTQLEQRDPRKAEVVNLRYFAGLSVAETAAVLQVSVGTVEREWRLARALLQRALDSTRD